MGESPQRKYRNEKVVIDGHTFDSEREGERYCELRLMQKAGEIDDLQIHPDFVLVPNILEEGHVVQRAVKYTADFSYISSGCKIVEDVKGVKTDVYKLKKKLMRYIYGIKITEIS